MRRVSCPRLIIFIFVYPLILCLLLLGIGVQFLASNRGAFLAFVSALYAFFVLVELLLYHNVFTIISINEAGISNKYICFSWSDALNNRIIDLKIGVLPVIFKASFLCVGDISGNSLLGLNPHNTVFLSLDKNTVDAIRSYAPKDFPVYKP